MTRSSASSATMPLSEATLPSLRLAVPGYERSSLRVGVVHIGVGGFHRAREAVYLDQLMNAGLALDWAICGIGVLPGDARMRDALAAQDFLYTLMEKHPDGYAPRSQVRRAIRLH